MGNEQSGGGGGYYYYSAGGGGYGGARFGGGGYGGGGARRRRVPKDPCPNMNFYEVLGVEREASTGEIRRSYLKKVVEAHPDKNLDDQEAAAKRFQGGSKSTRDEYNRSPGRFHREVADCADGANSDETDPDDESGEYEYEDDEDDIYEDIPFMFFNGRGFGRSSGFNFRPPPRRNAAYDEAGVSPDYTGPRSEVSVDDIMAFLKTFDDLVWTDDTTHPQCAYTHISAFFLKLAKDDQKFSHRSDASYPPFGSARSAFDRSLYRDEERPGLDGIDAHRFYGFWNKFETGKKFDWLEPYLCGCGSPACPANRENKKVQMIMKARFNEVVRLVVSELRDIDPRYAEHLRRKDDSTAYSASTIKKLDEERQRQKAKKKDKKRKAKGKGW
ncbi:DnaJ-domain-containing protein [Hymenopellis radicata]|nr:DnaJ-domain-containing protein [Hymenopellis radicata]